MYVADFETTTEKVNSKKSQVWLWGLKRIYKEGRLEYGIDLNDFLDTLVKERVKVLYFHNANFDGNYLFKHLLQEGSEFVYNLTSDPNQIRQLRDKFGDSIRIEPKDYELKEKEWSWVCDDRGNIFAMMINHKGHTFKVYDSLKYLGLSVEDVGIKLGNKKHKLELDYDAYSTFKDKKDVPREAIEYLERDIDIVIDALKTSFKMYPRRITKATAAIDNFRDFYGPVKYAKDFGGTIWNYKEKKFEWKNILNRDEYELIRRSYQGGYVNWDKKITDIDLDVPNGVSYDFNKLYGSILKRFKIVYGELLNFQPKGTCATIYVVHIKHAHIKDESHPALIRDKSGDDKYLHCLKNEERVIWKQEFEYLQKYYDIDFKIYKKQYFRTKIIFRDWIKEQEKKLKNAENGVQENQVKGVVNLLSGKNAQKETIGMRVIIKNDNSKISKSKLKYGTTGKEFVHSHIYLETNRFRHIGVSSYITMLGRMELFPTIMQNTDKWLYSDTDSCYFSDEPEGLWIHDTKWGAMKPEHKFTRFKVLQAKTYMFYSAFKWNKKTRDWKRNNKTVKKISGISKSGKIKINWRNFYLGSIIKDGMRKTKNVEGGKLILENDFKLGEGGVVE